MWGVQRGIFAYEAGMMIQNCPICKKLILTLDLSLKCVPCKRCLQKTLSRTCGVRFQKVAGLSVHYLFSWAGSDSLLKELHIFLKTKSSQHFLEFLGAQFHRQSKLQYIWVPVPNSQVSLSLAERLSVTLGGEVKTLLVWKYKKAPHKTLRKKERNLSRMALVDSEWKPSSNKTYVLVDDVVTTGATSSAAFNALLKPRHFEVWTVSCRT